MTEITPLAPQSAQAAVMQRLSAARDPRAVTSTMIARSNLGPADHLELSTAAALLAKLDTLPPIREQLVAQLRVQIASGAYELDIAAKIDATIDRLVEDLVGSRAMND